MTFKIISALCMGLILQLSQVRLSAAAETGISCGNSESMSCCTGRDSCPCAKESDSQQNPPPLFPATVDFKLLVSKTSEPDQLEASVSPPSDKVFSNTCRLDSMSGYAGLPLSVAFCTFVI